MGLEGRGIAFFVGAARSKSDPRATLRGLKGGAAGRSKVRPQDEFPSLAVRYPNSTLGAPYIVPLLDTGAQAEARLRNPTVPALGAWAKAGD
jgi:hypothetical protein